MTVLATQVVQRALGAPQGFVTATQTLSRALGRDNLSLVLVDAPTGMVGILTVELTSADGSIVVYPTTTQGITETPSGSGRYVAMVPRPLAGEYFVVWQAVGTVVFADLQVVEDPGIPPVTHTMRDHWPEGTVVNVYPAAAQPVPGQQPSGSPVATETVVDGRVTFIGLEPRLAYVAYANGKGVRFLVTAPISSEFTEASDRREAVEQRVTVMEGQIGGPPDSSIDLLDQRLDDVEAVLGSVVTTETLDAAVAAALAASDLSSDLAALTTTVGGHTTSLAGLSATVSGHTTSIADLVSDLAALTGLQAADAAAILALQAQGIKLAGATVVATTQARTDTAYGLLSTPDRVQGVVVPTGGLIQVAYQATWQESVQGAARAAIFVGANQLRYQTADAGNATGPILAEALINHASAVDVDKILATWTGGLLSLTNRSSVSAYSGDVTTGQAIGGGSLFDSGGADTLPHYGICTLFVDPGTYDISVQFKASSGTVTAKNRRLWVWTAG